VTERIYLDFAATTPVRREVVEAMLPYLAGRPLNASSVHADGRAARAALDDARSRVAACIGAKPKEIVFTASGSEANNLALTGVAVAAGNRSRHIVSTAIEHHAVLHALDALREASWETTLADVDANGLLDPDRFAAELRPGTFLASVMYANNEIGTVQPIAGLAAVARSRGVYFHTDAIQAAAYLPVDVTVLGVDLLSIAGHKLYGPHGAGALYVRTGTPLTPTIRGGGQESGRRAGTENLPAVVGLATALELALDERTQTAARIATLRDEFEARVLAAIPGARINAAAAPRVAHVSSLSFAGVDSEALLMRLDLDGLAVSAGSACTSGVIEPSHVLRALRLPDEWTRGVLRFSFGRTTTAAEIGRAVKVLEQAIADLRSVSPAVAGE
jgi:cysteine desulfurase